MMFSYLNRFVTVIDFLFYHRNILVNAMKVMLVSNVKKILMNVLPSHVFMLSNACSVQTSHCMDLILPIQDFPNFLIAMHPVITVHVAWDMKVSYNSLLN